MTVHFKKKNFAAQLRFAKLRLKNPQGSWNNVFWPDETKMEMLGHNSQCFVQQKPTGEYGQNQLIPVNDVRHGGGG